MRAQTPARRDAGFAAAAGLLALLLAGTIGAAIAELSRLEVVLARHRKATSAALAAVDACAEHAVASLPVAWDFSDVLVGDDGTPGTPDDGRVPLAADCTGAGEPAPGPATPERFVLELEATRRGGRRRLRAIVGRDSDPGVPSLVWTSDATAIGRIDGTLALDGNDPAGTRQLSLLAAPGEPEDLDAWVAAQGGAVIATPGTAAPIWAPPPPLAALVTRVAAAGAVTPDVGLATAPPAVSQLMLASGDLAITSPRFGAGILVVDGVLRIEAPVAFTGLVAATGGLRVEATGVLDLQGALWLGAASLEAVRVEGQAAVVASAGALAAADALFPLPRRARVASVLDF